ALSPQPGPADQLGAKPEAGVLSRRNQAVYVNGWLGWIAAAGLVGPDLVVSFGLDCYGCRGDLTLPYDPSLPPLYTLLHPDKFAVLIGIRFRPLVRVLGSQPFPGVIDKLENDVEIFRLCTCDVEF